MSRMFVLHIHSENDNLFLGNAQSISMFSIYYTLDVCSCVDIKRDDKLNWTLLSEQYEIVIYHIAIELDMWNASMNIF